MGFITRGDKGALNELYSRYSKPMMYYFYRMLGQSKEKSRDFLQDLFLKIIEKPELFDPKRHHAVDGAVGAAKITEVLAPGVRVGNVFVIFASVRL